MRCLDTSGELHSFSSNRNNPRFLPSGSRRLWCERNGHGSTCSRGRVCEWLWFRSKSAAATLLSHYNSHHALFRQKLRCILYDSLLAAESGLTQNGGGRAEESDMSLPEGRDENGILNMKWSSYTAHTFTYTTLWCYWCGLYKYVSLHLSNNKLSRLCKINIQKLLQIASVWMCVDTSW